MLRNLITVWVRHINPRIASLITAIGISGFIASLFALWIVGTLSDEVLEQESFEFDTVALLWIHQFANPTLDRIMLTLTKLGDPGFVMPLATISFAFLLLKRHWREAQFFAIACLGAVILNTGLKLVFSKPRPVLWDRLITEDSFSFPSGHALGSTVLYGFLAYLLAIHFPRFAGFIYTGAIALIVAISISRLYLGVHWLTDILAGWAIGFLWTMVCVTMLKLGRRMTTDRNTDRHR